VSSPAAAVGTRRDADGRKYGKSDAFSVKPGLTCLWQVSGRSNLSFEQWMQLDLEYIDHWSLKLDASILLRTIPQLFWHAALVNAPTPTTE